jgi:folate-binding Fe-S cluster repair protein YgfZ
VFAFTQKDAKGARGYLLDFDARANETPPLLDLLKRFVLRAKVRVRDVSDEHDVWAVWGTKGAAEDNDSRSWAWANSGAVEPVRDSAGPWPWGGIDGQLNDRRAPGMGLRVLTRKGDTRESRDA